MGIFNLTIQDPLERIKTFWKLSGESTDPENVYWNTSLHQHITPHSATVHSPQRCTATYIFNVTQLSCNMTKNLHGGAAATLFDVLTSISIAPIAEEGRFSYAGVTRTLNCTYLRPVPLGTKVLVSCEVMAVSGRLAHIRGWMRECDDEGNEKGEIMVVCEHGKVNTDAKL